jgi:hypothetical protein
LISCSVRKNFDCDSVVVAVVYKVLLPHSEPEHFVTVIAFAAEKVMPIECSVFELFDCIQIDFAAD